MVRGLAANCTEHDLEILFPGAVQCRLIRERGSGESRGFGFVEFASVHDAERFMANNSIVRFQTRVLHVDYSHGRQEGLGGGSGSSGSGNSNSKMDWICNVAGCDGYNFARRSSCFQCNVPKDAHLSRHVTSDERVSMQRGQDAFDSATPSQVLVLRGLDNASTEDSVQALMQYYGSIKEVRLVRDKVTNQSRGFAFVEFTSVEAATNCMQTTNSTVRIDNVQVRVSYCADKKIDKASGAAGGRRAKGAPKRPPNIAATFNWDDSSGYWFDETSRFYYNDTTQLYYHAETSIYYRWDINTGNYVQTDERGVLMSTIQAQQAEEAKHKKQKKKKKTSAAAAALAMPVGDPNQPEELSEIVKKKEEAKGPLDRAALLGNIKFSLKTVNKDLLRWKKIKEDAVQSAKQNAVDKVKRESEARAYAEQQKTAMAAMAAAEKGAGGSQDGADSQRVVVPAPAAASAKADMGALATTAGGAGGSDRRADKWLDYKRTACLLCQRQFKSIEVLHKHCDKSELHKKNLQIQEFKEIHKNQREEAQVPHRTMRVQSETPTLVNLGLWCLCLPAALLA